MQLILVVIQLVIKIANTETWDGTSWTEVNDLNTARYNLASCWGTDQYSALALWLGYTLQE